MERGKISIFIILLLMIVPLIPIPHFNQSCASSARFLDYNTYSLDRYLSEIRVAYYDGPGSWIRDDVTIPRLFEWMGCSVTMVRGDDIRNGCLDDFDVLAWPGGDYVSYWGEVGLEGKSKIQDFVSSGGAYFGVCAGAYYACDYMVWMDDPAFPAPLYKVEGDELNLDLFPGVAHGPIFDITERPPWYTMTRINIINRAHPITDSLPEYMQILYYGGPYLQPYEDADVTVLGTYDVTGTPAIVACDYGQGRVFLMGPHSELEEDSDRDGWPSGDEGSEWFMSLDDEGSDWPLLLEAVKWLTQASVERSVDAVTGSGTVLFNPNSGFLSSLSGINEYTLPTSGKPDLEFAHGFFSFMIEGVTEGQDIVLTITFPSDIPVGAQYWTCQDGVWNQIPFDGDDGDNVITITLTDSGLGDADGVANGVVEDPGGIGIPSATGAPNIPGFPLEGILLGIAVAAVTVYLLRKRTVQGTPIGLNI